MNNNRKCSTAVEMHLVKEVFPGYFVAKVVNNVPERQEVTTKCYPFTMDDVKMFAHRCINNPKIWVVTELSTGLRVTDFDHSTKKAAITEVEDIIRQKPGRLQKCISNTPKLFETAKVEINDCTTCGHIICKLLENGMSDLCKGKGFVHKGIVSPSPSPSPSPASVLVNTHDQRTAHAAKELRAALDEWNEKYGKNSHNFEWEAEMDCLMAPPAPEQPPASIPPKWGEFTREFALAWKPPEIDNNNIEYGAHCIIHRCHLPRVARCNSCRLTQDMTDQCWFNKFKNEPIKDKELLKQRRPTTLKGALPDLWMEKPSSDLINFRDNSKFLGIYDPESVQDRLEAASWYPEMPWDLKKGYPVFTWEYRAYKERPNAVQRCYAGDDSFIRESELDHYKDGGYTEDDSGNDEYISPHEQAREFGDEDAIRFVPAYIFRSGKPQWKAMTAFDKQGFPYRKMVKYPSIRPIACRVEIKNGYVIPAGKAGSSLKITTRADKKRIRAWSEIRKELTPYVGAERAGKMAGQQVAAMATC